MYQTKVLKQFSEIDDIDTLIDLIHKQFETYGVTKSSQKIINSLKSALNPSRQAYLFLISDEKSSILGFSFANICSGLESGGKYLWINELFISPEKRGEGVGKCLIKYIEQWCLENQIHYVSFTTGTQNKSAQDFYIKNGYNLSNSIWVDKSI